jgi:hypothetical protein
MNSPPVSTLLLLAKSETNTIRERHRLVNFVGQRTCPGEHDVASSITVGEAVILER